MDRPISELLERSRSGDARALEELLQEVQGQVYRFGMKMCRDPEDAKDVLQETLLAMARGVRDFRGASSISTWLYTIARSFCIKKRRQRKGAPNQVQSLEVESHESPEPVDPGQTPDEALARKQVEHALQAAVGALDPKYREVFILRDMEGLTAPEVAEVMGLSVEAVKSRLHRARLDVRESLAPLLETPSAPPAVSKCPDVASMFSRYLEGELSAETCTKMAAHLTECPHCQATCDSLKRTLALRSSLPELEVPRAVQDKLRAEVTRMLATNPGGQS